VWWGLKVWKRREWWSMTNSSTQEELITFLMMPHRLTKCWHVQVRYTWSTSYWTHYAASSNIRRSLQVWKVAFDARVGVRQECTARFTTPQTAIKDYLLTNHLWSPFAALRIAPWILADNQLGPKSLLWFLLSLVKCCSWLSYKGAFTYTLRVAAHALRYIAN